MTSLPKKLWNIVKSRLKTYQNKMGGPRSIVTDPMLCLLGLSLHIRFVNHDYYFGVGLVIDEDLSCQIFV
jgi:hypothetical protein